MKTKLPLTELRDKKKRDSRIVDDFLIEYRSLEIILQWFRVRAQTRRGHIRTNQIAPTDNLLRNEMVHVIQQIHWGWKFMFLYFYLFVRTVLKGKRAYLDHPLEKESVELAKEKRGWEQVTKESWRKYE